MFRIVLSSRTSLARGLPNPGGCSTFMTNQFHVFIPHEQQRPGGLTNYIRTQFSWRSLSLPHSQHPFNGEAPNRTGRTYPYASYLRYDRNEIVSLLLCLSYFFMKFFGPLYRFWRPKGLPYSYCVDTAIYFWDLTLRLYYFGCQPVTIPCVTIVIHHLVMMYFFSIVNRQFQLVSRNFVMCISITNLSIRFSFALLESYVSFLRIILTINSMVKHKELNWF